MKPDKLAWTADLKMYQDELTAILKAPVAIDWSPGMKYFYALRVFFIKESWAS